MFALALCAPAHATPQTATGPALVGAINDVRAAQGLKPLRVDVTLVRAARAHTASMLSTGVFSHGSFAQRIDSFGARGPYFAENLAWGTGLSASARALVQTWLASPGHRANVLRSGFRRVGIGLGVGAFAGYSRVTVVTADFAGR